VEVFILSLTDDGEMSYLYHLASFDTGSLDYVYSFFMILQEMTVWKVPGVHFYVHCKYISKPFQ